MVAREQAQPIWDGTGLVLRAQAAAQRAEEGRRAQQEADARRRAEQAAAAAEAARAAFEHTLQARFGITTRARVVMPKPDPQNWQIVAEVDGLTLTPGYHNLSVTVIRPCSLCGEPIEDDHSATSIADIGAILGRPPVNNGHMALCAGVAASPEGDPPDEDTGREVAANLRRFAGTAWAEREARERREMLAALEAEAARRAGVLARLLRRELGVVAEPTGGAIDLDGVTLRLDEDGYAEGHLYAVLPCPGCGETVDNRVTSLASLGRQIAQPLKCRACRQLAQAGEDGSTTDRMVAALLAFVEEAVDGRG